MLFWCVDAVTDGDYAEYMETESEEMQNQIKSLDQSIKSKVKQVQLYEDLIAKDERAMFALKVKCKATTQLFEMYIFNSEGVKGRDKMNELYGGQNTKRDKKLHALLQKLGRPTVSRLQLDQKIVTFQTADYGEIRVYHQSQRQAKMVCKLVRVATFPYGVCIVPKASLQNLTENRRKRKKSEAAVQRQLT